MRGRILRCACLIAWVASYASATQAQSDPYLVEEAPDVVFTAPIVAKAQELGNDPVRIYEFVRNELEFQNYYGLMKGPEATLRSGGGNDYDLAALLVSMLRNSGIRARFVRGKIQVPTDAAAAWTGIDEVAAPGLGWLDGATIAVYFGYAMPETWRDANADADAVGARLISGTPAKVAVTHIWVEAEVPMARYRGAGAGGDNRGKAWIPLDPSFKLSTWPADPQLPIDQNPDLTFDYTGPDGLYSRVRAKLPNEIFEDQLRAYLADTHVSGTAARSVDEVLLFGTIIPESPGVLPNALPYELNAALPPRRAASLIDLHQSAAGWPDLAGTAGASSYRYERSVHVCVQGTANCDTTLPSSSSKLLQATGWSAEWQGHRILLTFPPSSSSEPYLPDDGYAQCDDTQGDPIDTVPTLTHDGTPVTADVVRNVELCNKVEVVLKETFPPDVRFGKTRHVDTVNAGGTYLVGIDSHAANATQTIEAAEALLAAQAAYPIAYEGDVPFVDDFVTDGVRDPVNEKYLAVHFEAQEALTGGLLHLADSWYYQRLRAAEARIIASRQMRPRFFSSSGMVAAGRTVAHLFGVPFAIQPSNLLVDIKGVIWEAAPRDSGLPEDVDDLGIELFGHTASAHEHAVWEELASVEAISTVKGFQLMSEILGLEVLVAKSLADANAILDAAVCGDYDCGGIDFRTYCELKKNFVGPGSWRVPAWDAACTGSVTDTTLELRIMEESLVDYHGWLGYVFYRASEITGGRHYSYAIHPEAQGGYALEDWRVDPFSGEGMDLYDLISVLYDLPSFLESLAGDPVSIFNGNYHTSEKDLEISGRAGMNLRLVRSYNSRSDYDGPLGYGWTHTYDQHLRIDDGAPEPGDERVVWVGEAGSEIPWDDPSPGTPGTLTPQEWNHDELVRNADGSFTLTTKAGMVYEFLAPGGAWSPGRARLASISDRNGNTITCNYDLASDLLATVTDTAGRDLVFHYDVATGHLETIEDWSGRKWRYVVDTNGDLTEYWDPVEQAKEESDPGTGSPWRYSYYSGLDDNPKLNHNLKCWIKPQDGRPAGDVASLCGTDGDGHSWMHFSYYSNDTVFKHTDALGDETRFSYNYFRRRTDVTHPDGSTETHFFDGYGNVTRFVDGRGNVREYDYNAPRRERVAERDAFGFESTAVYDDFGNPLVRVDRLAEQERWTYNDFGQPTFWENRRGHRRDWQYDANGNLIGEWAEVGGALELMKEHDYDTFGNRIETREYQDPGGPSAPARTRFVYDAQGVGLVKAIDPLGHVVRVERDSLGRPKEIGRDRTVEEDGAGKVERVVVKKDYDRLDRVVATTDPAGLVLEVDLDANGLVKERRSVVPNPDPGQTDPLEVRLDERNAYDAADRLVTRMNAVDAARTFSYDPRGRVTRIESALGRVTLRDYDANGNLVREIDPAGAEWQWGYDAANRPVWAMDPLGRTSTTLYDEEGRPIRREGPGGRVIDTVAYDEVGNAELVQDGEGHAFSQTFDELNRLLTRTGPLGTAEQGTTTFSYDLPGRLVSREDAENHTMQVRYDAVGRVIETLDGLSRPTSFSYDEVGNLIKRVDAAGRKLALEYDSRGLITRRRSLDDWSVDDSFIYDARGRRTLSKNPVATVAYQYDALDRLVAVEDPSAGTARRSYDADGRMVQYVYPADDESGFPEGIVVHYQYDGRNQLTSIVDPIAGVWRFEHDEAGREVRRTDPTGFERTVSYVEEGFVDRVEFTNASGALESWAYREYDDLGNPRYIDVTPSGGGTETTEVAYDSLSRVTSAIYPGTEGSESFGYDLVGNRVSHTDRSGQATVYDVDAANQLQAIRLPAGDLVQSFDYDAAGRLASRKAPDGSEVESYSYDCLGRLKTFTRNDGYGFTLVYDADGEKRARIMGADPASYLRGGIELRSGVKTRIVTTWAGEGVLAEIVSGEVRGLLRDGSGNVAHVTQGSAPGYARRYAAFGEVRSESGSLPIERGFASQRTEGQSGLIHMGARHYDPRLGRFLQSDPLGIAADQLYAYAANNPYVFWDPLGLAPMGIVNDTLDFLWDVGLVLDAGLRGIFLALGDEAVAIGNMFARDPIVVGLLNSLEALDAAYGTEMDAATFALTLIDVPAGLGLLSLREAASGGRITGGLMARLLRTRPALQYPVNISTAGLSADESAAVVEYATRANAWLAEAGPQTIRSTQGTLRAEGSALARAERLRAARAGQPYQGQVGHVPDTAVSGAAEPPAGWLDMPGASNQVCGGVLGCRVGQTIDHFTVDGAAP